MSSDHSALVHGLLTGFELAKAERSAVTVDLPHGWRLEAEAALDQDDDSVEDGISFVVHLPDGTMISSWNALRKRLQDTMRSPYAAIATTPLHAQVGTFRMHTDTSHIEYICKRSCLVVRSDVQSPTQDVQVRRGSRQRSRPLDYQFSDREVRENRWPEV